jgi:hypothetical protein
MVVELDRDSVEIDDLMACDKVSIEIKPYKGKRSMNANAYAWVLIDKLASVLGISPEEVYRETIRSLGGVSEIVQCKTSAVARLKAAWQSRGLGWQVETVDGKDGWVNCIMYYGSSTYDTAQMKRLIDALVEECKLQSIDVMSEKERGLLIDKWN